MGGRFLPSLFCLRPKGFPEKFLIPSKSKSEWWSRHKRKMVSLAQLVDVSKQDCWSRGTTVAWPSHGEQKMGERKELLKRVASQDWRWTAAVFLENSSKNWLAFTFPTKKQGSFHTPLRTKTLPKEVSFSIPYPTLAHKAHKSLWN